MIARRHAIPGLTALAAALLAVHPARAAEGAPPAVIFLYAQDQADQARAVFDVVSSQLEELAVAFREVGVERFATSAREQLDAVAAIAASAETIAVFWCDLSSDRDALLHLTDGRGSRLLVRRLEIADVHSRAESIAIVVQSSVRALLAGGTIGVAVPERAKPAPPRPAPPARPAPDRLAMKVAYAVTFRSADNLFNHGLFLGLECRFAPFLSAFAAYTISAPVEGSGELADARVSSHRLSLGVGLGYSFGRLSIGAATSLDLDFAAVEVTDVAPGLTAVDDDMDVIVAFTPSVRVAFAATERISVFAEIGAAVPANAKRYTARSGETREVLVEAWPVQPVLRVGFAAWLF